MVRYEEKRMSGLRFVDALKRIGYEGNLCAESFDWTFEHEAILPFLEWFCDSIHAQNILSDDELKRYCRLFYLKPSKAFIYNVKQCKTRISVTVQCQAAILYM